MAMPHHEVMNCTLTAILTREGDGFVALCPEVDVASQGLTVEEAKANLKEAVELFFECASQDEINLRMVGESYISAMEVQLA
jgi:predicted RNase H-like HicB family nuclease